MGQTTDAVAVTVTSTRLIVSQNGLSLVFGGQDIIRAEALNAPSHPSVNTVPNAWFIRLYLTGPIREVYTDGHYDILLNAVSSPSTWNDKVDPRGGALVALAAITPMIRSAPSGGGGGQVDTIVPGAAIDVDSTDPVNPIVNVKVDGVTIGINGLNELEVPAGGGGYVPTTRLINTTAPISGGGDLSANRTITHDNSGVVAAAYTNASVTVDAKGHVTAASSGAAPVTSVGATYPIQSSGGATPTISADTSLGGNGAADDGKVVIFGSLGEITASASAFVNALTGTAVDGSGVYGSNNSVVAPAAKFVNLSGDIAHFHNVTAQGLEVENDGGLDWTSGTGAQTTADNLPVFGALTKGVVPAAGAVPAATNFLDETGNWDAVDVADLSGLGTGVATALGNNADSASGFVTQTGGDTRYIQNSLVAAKGDIIGASANDTPAITTVGTDGQVLMANSVNASGLGYGWAVAQYTIAPTSTAAAVVSWTNMPAALTFFLGQARWFISADLTNRTRIRLSTITLGAAASANAKLRILYKTEASGYSATITDYVTIGSSEVQVSLGTSINTFVTSGWIDIVAGAKGPVLIALAGIDGDGAADPGFGAVTFEVS